MTNELQLAAPQPVTPEQANAWVGLATTKNQTAYELSKMELQGQSILLPVQNSDAYQAIDFALAEYRKHHTSTVELRKNFTAVIDSKIIQPLMAFEKRMDPKSNEPYSILVARSLSLRKEEADKAAEQNAKNQEIANFKAHVQNEFIRVVTEYRTMIRRCFTEHYNLMLKDKVADPSLEKVQTLLMEIKPGAVNKFTSHFLKHEELVEIYSKERSPNYQEVFHDLISEMETLFSNYSSDVANAEKAIKHHEDAAKLLELEEQNKAKEESAMNYLITTVEAVTIEEPKIKRMVQVKVIESEQWSKAVMAAFITNLAYVGKLVRVKKWSNLTIGQMAVALGQHATENGNTFTGLELVEVEK